MQLVEHDDGGAAVVVDEPPEVRRGALQRVQGHDEGCAPCVALRGNQASARPAHRPTGLELPPRAVPRSAHPERDSSPLRAGLPAGVHFRAWWHTEA